MNTIQLTIMYHLSLKTMEKANDVNPPAPSGVNKKLAFIKRCLESMSSKVCTVSKEGGITKVG